MGVGRVVVLVLSLAGLLSGAIVCAPSSAASQDTMRGYVLKYQHRDLGRVNVLLGPDKAKLTSFSVSALLNSDRSVIVYSDETKRYARFNKSDWNSKARAFWRAPRYDWPISAWKKIGDQSILGVKCMHYRRSCGNHQPYPDNKTYVEDLWCTYELSTDKAVMSSLSRAMKSIFETALPMKFQETRYWAKQSSRETRCEILSIKKAEIPLSEFTVPRTYKLVADEMDVFTQDEGISDIIEPPDLSGIKTKPRPLN